MDYTISHRKVLSLLAAAILFVSMFLSSFFIASELHHDCTGEDCPVCSVLQLCETQLRELGSSIAVLSFALPFYLFFTLVLSYFSFFFFAHTLITSKVRLNN